MVFLKNFFGGLCNNLLQFNNALEFLRYNELDYSYLKINTIHTNKRDRDNYLKLKIFNNLHKHYVKLDRTFLKRTKHITYKKYPPIKIDNNKNYILERNFYAKDYTLGIYNYLDIFQYQKEIYERFYDILKNNLICFHIRLGDFLRNPKYKKYVKSKSKIIRDINKTNYYLILTNPESIDYVKDITKDFKNIIYAYDLNLPLDEELLLGSVCNNIIINPGSTFSTILFRFNNHFKKRYKKI